jgi:ssDNA thymidine ADP-ribosyltransferase, DarT
MINPKRKYCYRLTHINNLNLLLQNGLVYQYHPKASSDYIDIGNAQIIDVRSTTPVKIDNYGMIGDYVPFYFTPKSIMLYNIITGYRHPLVPKRNQDELLLIRCLIADLAKLPQWFFTDGQGNNSLSHHYNDLARLDEIDWESIQNSHFSKTDNDTDRPRRYQAEFLVHEQVKVQAIESLQVYSQQAANQVIDVLKQNSINLAVEIQPKYFF